MKVEGVAIVNLVEGLLPGHRVAVNGIVPAVYGKKEVFIGGVYRDEDGNWFAYDENVTDGAEDAGEAISILLDVLSDFEIALRAHVDTIKKLTIRRCVYVEAI